MIPREALVAALRAANGAALVRRTDSEILFDFVPEEARRVLLDGPWVLKAWLDQGRAEGRQEAFEEAAKELEFGADVSSISVVASAMRTMAQVIRALAARDKGGGANESISGVAYTRNRTDVTVAGSPSRPSGTEAMCGTAAGEKSPGEPAATSRVVHPLDRDLVSPILVGGAGTSPLDAGHGERRPDEVESCSPAGAPDSCDEVIWPEPKTTTLGRVYSDEKIADVRLGAARAVRDAIAARWPGLEAREVMTDADLAAILRRAGEGP